MLARARLSHIYHNGKSYSYPLDLAEVVGNLGWRQSLLTVASCLKGLTQTSAGRWRMKLGLPDGSERYQEVDQLISSVPLGWLVHNLDPSLPATALEAADALRYRDFLTVAMIRKSTNSFPDNWQYFHDPQLRVGRIQNFSNWPPEMVPDPSMVCYGMEYFCSQTDELWKSSDAGLIRLATQ